jgi:hypothetical protein
MHLPVRCLLSVLVLCLAFLHTTHAAACTNTFANYTTCAAINGLAASGDAATFARTSTLDAQVDRNRVEDEYLAKTPECTLQYNKFKCISLGVGSTTTVYGAKVPYFSAPCHADGSHLLPCYAWCLDFRRACYAPSTAMALDNHCSNMAAKNGDNKCFGDNGILGMKAVTIIPAAAPALLASTFLAPLALFTALSARFF